MLNFYKFVWYHFLRGERPFIKRLEAFLWANICYFKIWILFWFKNAAVLVAELFLFGTMNPWFIAADTPACGAVPFLFYWFEVLVVVLKFRSKRFPEYCWAPDEGIWTQLTVWFWLN